MPGSAVDANKFITGYVNTDDASVTTTYTIIGSEGVYSICPYGSLNVLAAPQRLLERIPALFHEADQIHRKQEQVMRNHARPRRNQTQPEQLRANERTDDADRPHADDVIRKRLAGIAHAVEHAFDDDREAEERFGHRNHAQHRRAERDDFFAA